MNYKTVLTFDGGYGRQGAVDIIFDGQCFKCKRSIVCLTIDGSDGEYDSATFCQDCLNGFFEELSK